MTDKREYIVAPCGMDCQLCQAYQGIGLECNGCGRQGKRKGCQNCSIKNCQEKSTFCFECKKFPCQRLKKLDGRYRQNYNMSMIENLNFIKQYGIEEFIKSQREKYTCNECKNLKSVHKDFCIYCFLKNKNKA